MQHFRQRILSGSDEKASVQGGGGGGPAGARVDEALSGGSAGISGCAGDIDGEGEVYEDVGEWGDGGWPTGDTAGKREASGVGIGVGGVAGSPTAESASESAGAGDESGIGDGGESIGGTWRVGSTGDSCSSSSESVSRNNSTSQRRLAAFRVRLAGGEMVSVGGQGDALCGGGLGAYEGRSQSTAHKERENLVSRRQIDWRARHLSQH